MSIWTILRGPLAWGAVPSARSLIAISASLQMAEPNEDAVHIILCIVGSVIDGFNRGRGFTLGPSQEKRSEGTMHFGGAMFFTDYSMSAMELARALEERGFESGWAPEHSPIPLSAQTPFPGGGELPKQYYDAMDPFVVLSAAFVPKLLTTDKLGSYGSAFRHLRLTCPHEQG